MTRDPKLIVLLFNECINNRDIAGLSDLLAEDYVFIDSSDEIHAGGKEISAAGWQQFFDLYPDYHNHFVTLTTRENLVLVLGNSTCSYEPLDGPAIWTARVENDLVAEWRVYLDTEENRRRLGLESNNSAT